MLYILCLAVGVIIGIILTIITLKIILLVLSKKKLRTTAAAKNTSKKTLEFPKFIVGLYAFACIAWIQQDYILALLYQKPINTEVTITLTTTLAATIIGTFIKSSFEKANRNKHHLDENGKPY